MKKHLAVWFLCLTLIVSLCNVSYARTTVGSSPTIDASSFTISPDGTSTNPSITFWNERTLGFYRSSTGVISVTGGTLSMLGGSYSLTDSDVAHGMTDIAATNVYGLLNALDAADKGGLRIQGLSDGDAIPLYIRGIIGSNNPTDTLEAISIIAAKKNGTGVQALGSVETALQLLNNTTELLTILGSGAFLISDNANTKNLVGLTVNQLTSDDEIFSFKSSDVGHSFTTDTELDTFFYGKKLSATLGGAGIWGLSDGDATGLQLTGAIGIADPTNTIPAVIINGVKLNGTTYGAVGNDEIVAQITNNGTALTTWLGNGNVGIGTGTFGTSAVKVMSFGQWTAPTTSPADVAQLGAADMQSAPGMTRLHQRTEAGITSPLALHDEVNALANPRRPSQAINMLAAVSGSTGITTADNANLDFGTGNFTLAFKGSIPDWTPSATVVLAQKTDGTNGWNLQVLTTGVIRLTVNVTNYDSTVAPVITDGMVAKIGVSVTRETAGVAGSVVFYFNGTQLGASVAIGAGAPTTVNNAVALYVLGTSSTRTAGQVHFFVPYNRALSAAEQLLLFRNGVDYSDKWAVNTEKITAQNDRDFSSSTIGNWVVYNVGGNGTVTYDDGPGAVKTGKVTAGATPGTATGARLNTTYITNILQNKRIRFSAQVYIPAGMSFTALVPALGANDDGTSSNAKNADVATTDAWQNVSVDFNIGNDLVFGFFINGNSTTAGDYFYFDNASIVDIGTPVAYEPEGIQPAPGQWLDSSTNKLHAMQPAAGSSVVRPMREFEIRWTNTWAGTHEAQYIGGVNQAVLPANCYLTQIIGVVTGGTIEDIIIGDGSDTDHWVAITTGLATGTTAFTIANPISDGTNYKLVVDPDANFTGSIAFTVKGFILQ